MAKSRVKGILVEIGGDTSGLQKALSKVNGNISSLSKELKDVNSLLKLDPKNTELANQKQKLLNDSIKETSSKLEELKEAQRLADEQIANGTEISDENYRALQREILETENKLKSLKAEASNWTKAGRSIEEFGNKVTNISSKIDKLGTTLTTRLTLPITAVGTYAVNSFKEVDEGADIVIKKTGAVGDSAEALKDVYKRVSSSVVGDFGDVGSAVGEINTRFGFTGEALEEASEKFLKFAKINDTDVNTAVQKVSRYMGDASIEASKYGEVLDQLSSVAQASGISIDSLSEMLTKYGAPMRALGLNTKESIAIFAGWEKAGVNTEIAFSGMKKAIGTWGKEGKNATKEFKKTLEQIKKCPDIASATTKAIAVFGQKAGPDLADAIKGGRFEYSEFLDILEKSEGTLENTYNGIIDETDEVQMSMKKLKVQFSEVGKEALKTLVPTLEKILDGVSGLISSYNKLDDKQKKQINNMIVFAAAIGPATKLLGTLGKTVGTSIKTVGNFTQAIGLIGKTSTDAFKKASDGTQSLAKGLTFLTSPVGLVTIGITALVGTLGYLAIKQSEATQKTRELAEETKNQKQTYEDYNKSIDETTRNNLAQIDSVSRLKEELKTLVDENGKVKEGYKDRVAFILNELNKALGTEYGLNGDIIQSYKDLQGEIDETIEKKRAEIVLKADEEKFAKARETETEAVKKQKEALDELGTSIGEARDKYQKLKEKKEEFEKSGNIYSSEYLDTGKQMTNLKNLIDAYENAGDTIKQCIEDKKEYESNYALWTEKKYSEIGKTVVSTTKSWTDASIKQIQDGIIKEQTNLAKYQQMYKDTGSEISEQQVKQSQQNLENLANELAERTKTIGTLGIEEISAWKTLADSSYEEYKKALSKVGPTTQEEIQKATGVIVEDNNIIKATGDKAYGMTENFDKKLEIGNRTKVELDNTATTINNDTSVGDASEELAKDVDTNFNNNIDGWTWGWDLVKNIYDGLTNKESKNWISKGASSIASIIKSILGFSLPEKGPLSDFDTSMPDMIDLMSKGINDNKGKVINSAERLANDLYKTLNENINFPQIHDFGKLQGKLSNKIIDSTKTVYTTPQIIFNVQELDEAKLQQCFNYINRKFGSSY